ncbi:MAG TPA: DUF368 domain-containing protein [Chryseosolibacter sp.]|nr:DUF368 domain-containing protein [Chryseosolibacter sp.]
MGATEVVSGVSGSTMAMILGIYNEFVHSLRSFDRHAVKLIGAGEFSQMWHRINGGFLMSILLGIVTGLIALAKITSYFVVSYFIPVSSFFFGVILISGILVFRKIKKWRIEIFFGFVAGFVINYGLTILPPFSTPANYLIVFIAGIAAGFVLLFPGLSSAFILLIIGKYELIVLSFSDLNAVVISIFFFGGLLGLWMGSRFIYRMLADYYNTTVALLAGLMLGALNKLWPWRVVFEYTTNGKGDRIPAFDKSVLPWHYMNLTGKDPQVFQAILMVALGVFLVVLIEKIAAGLKTKI